MAFDQTHSEGGCPVIATDTVASRQEEATPQTQRQLKDDRPLCARKWGSEERVTNKRKMWGRQQVGRSSLSLYWKGQQMKCEWRETFCAAPQLSTKVEVFKTYWEVQTG